MPGARGGETPPADEKRILQGNLISLQGNNDTKESNHICIPVPITAWTNFPAAHWR